MLRNPDPHGPAAAHPARREHRAAHHRLLASLTTTAGTLAHPSPDSTATVSASQTTPAALAPNGPPSQTGLTDPPSNPSACACAGEYLESTGPSAPGAAPPRDGGGGGVLEGIVGGPAAGDDDDGA